MKAEKKSNTTPDLIVTLASELPALWQASSMRAIGGKRTPKTDAADARIYAIEDLISRSEARSIDGAAVQLMLAAANIVSALGVEVDPEDADYITGKLESANRLVWSALAAVRRTTGTDMSQFQIASYAPDYLWPFPSDPLPTPDLIEDGTGPTRQVEHPDALLLNLSAMRDDLFNSENDAAGRQCDAIEQLIAATPAKTLAGISVRLAQLRRCIEHSCTVEQEERLGKIADSILSDLRGLLPDAQPVAEAEGVAEQAEAA